jgi:hypothetical protein
MKRQTISKYCYGKLASRPDYKTLRFSRYMKDVAPPPDMFDNIPIVIKTTGISDISQLFPMDGNDRLGDCTIAALAHAITCYNARIGKTVIPSKKDVINFYYKMTCHRDKGCNELDVLKRWQKKGFNGDKIISYVSERPTNHIGIKQAIWLFGGLYIGFQVQENADYDFENGITWTPGTLTQDGHAVYLVAYDADTVTVLTWGGKIKATWAWLDECVDECWPILPSEAQIQNFAPGFNIDLLNADLQALSQ